jgi:ribosomal protein L29
MAEETGQATQGAFHQVANSEQLHCLRTAKEKIAEILTAMEALKDDDG